MKVEAIEKLNLTAVAFKKKYEEIIKKSCLCNDLGEGVLVKNSIEKKNIKHFPAICPGPNIAYFSKIVSLKEMVSHIYGRINLLNDTYRPNMFIKELKMYVEYFIKEIKKAAISPDDKQIAYLNEFRNNMLDGIAYYKELFPLMLEESKEYRDIALEEVEYFRQKMELFASQYNNIFKLTHTSV